MTSLQTVTIAACGLLVVAVLPAQAACVRKSAVATSTTTASAKWFALETMVQSVSWGLWPGFVATGEVSGYKITKQRYKCKPEGLGVTCNGTATFCKTS